MTVRYIFCNGPTKPRADTRASFRRKALSHSLPIRAKSVMLLMIFAPLSRFSYENYLTMITLKPGVVNIFLQIFPNKRAFCDRKDHFPLEKKKRVYYNVLVNLCGCSSSVEHQLPKLNRRVRLPSSAPQKTHLLSTKRCVF